MIEGEDRMARQDWNDPAQCPNSDGTPVLLDAPKGLLFSQAVFCSKECAEGACDHGEGGLRADGNSRPRKSDCILYCCTGPGLSRESKGTGRSVARWEQETGSLPCHPCPPFLKL